MICLWGGAIGWFIELVCLQAGFNALFGTMAVLFLVLFMEEHQSVTSPPQWALGVACIALESLRDNLLFGRAGISLCYLVPCAALLFYIKKVCSRAFLISVFVASVVGLVAFEAMLAWFLLGKPLNFLMIIVSIGVNLSLGSLFSLGMRGNRSFNKEERKVWTPNRKVPYEQIICK